ncbi:MAG: glycine cleavage system protein GcvH [Erysipelotrichaceae bacterium]|nr:glycine cleavage system protein GcvH [Erysipelotrichaceae bacterium]
MKINDELFYTKTHEWVKWLDDNTAVIGISDHAQHALGDIVFINLPQVGQSLTVSEPFGDVESVKAVSDVYSPVTGVVSKINESLLDSPEAVNEDAYQSWFIEVTNITDKTELLNSEQYKLSIVEE